MRMYKTIRENSNGSMIAEPTKKYCPVCYEDYYVCEDVCPKCGTPLEEPFTEEEEAEYIEMLLNTRL